MTEVKDRMLGEPAGRISSELPRDWVAMRMLGNAETIHAVPAGNVALCGHQSATGWQWARGWDVSCPHCLQKIAEAELDRDDIVQTMRRYGIPLTRDNYIEFAGLDTDDWCADWEAELPELLRDYTETQWPWPKRKRRRRTSK
jgi:hypothetical protein